MNQLKTISIQTKEFMANGRKYVVSPSVTPLRFKEYEKLVPAFSFGLSWQNVYSQVLKAFELLNKQQFANAAVVMHNIANGIKTIDDPNRIHPALEMCALVINREDEDLRTYNRDLMLEKIADWQAEGYDMQGFFHFALNTIQGLKEELIKFTSESLQEIQKELNNP